MHGDGSKVKGILRQQGRTTTWLARELGYERSAFEHVLAGDRPPKDPLFWERIAGILGVSITAIHADVAEVA